MKVIDPAEDPRPRAVGGQPANLPRQALMFSGDKGYLLRIRHLEDFPHNQLRFAEGQASEDYEDYRNINLEFQSASNCLLGYRHVVLFFLGSIVGFYGAAIFAVWLMAWGAGLHKYFKQHLFLAANALLVILGLWYLARAYWVA